MTNNAGTIDAAGVLKMERILPAPIERVWQYLIDAEKRAGWLGGGSMAQQPGESFDLHFDHSRFCNETPPARMQSCEASPPQKQRLLKIEPPRLLTMLWDEGGGAESEVSFELSPAGEQQTRLVLIHRRLPDREQLLLHTSGWHAHLDVLNDLLQDRHSSPFWSNFAQLKAFYQQRISE